MSEFKLICDRCEKPTANPLVDWSTEPPLILCQRCYALARAKGKYDKLPRLKDIPRKPKAYVRGDRHIIFTPVHKVNTSEIKVEYFENGERVGWDLVTNIYAANMRKYRWLDNGEMIKSKGRKSIAMNTKKSGALNKDTQAYKNKLNYINKWAKEKMEHLHIYLNKEKDAELIELIKTAPSKSELLREMYKAYKER